MTQDRSANPPNEATIAGSALARIVWSIAARNIANITPGKTRRNAARNASGLSGAGVTPALEGSSKGMQRVTQRHRASGAAPRQRRAGVAEVPEQAGHHL